MLYILRPSDGYLALAETDGDGHLLALTGAETVALPDAAFWALLKAGPLSIYDRMVAENPARMARVEANGVGRLRSEKTILAQYGLSNATAHTAKIPTAVPPLPTAIGAIDGR